MINLLFLILGLLIGFMLGLFNAKILQLTKRVTEIKEKLDKPEPKRSQVTIPSYFPISETKQTSQIINPKTPQQLEREATERERKEILGIK